MKVYEIQTKPQTGTFPYFKGFAYGLNAGDSYTLSNSLSTVKFPFYPNPQGIPQIQGNSTWTRVNALGAPITGITSINAFNSIYASTQKFNYITFSVINVNSQGIVGTSINFINGVPGILSNGVEYYYDITPIPGTTIREITITFVN